MIEITGTTCLTAIIADPVAHVRTPQAINSLAAERGLDAIMVPLHVASEFLGSTIGMLRVIRNFSGMVVTVPHKREALKYCDEVSTRARQAGAVNVIGRLPDGRLSGDMLDGWGFLEGLLCAGIEPRFMRVFLVGAGGAASAIAFALAERGVKQLSICNRSEKKATQLVTRISAEYPKVKAVVSQNDPSGHELVVNGTTLGLRPNDPMPTDASRIDQWAVVADVIMQPEFTPFLEAARTRNLRIHTGRQMLLAQLNLIAKHIGISS